MTQDRDDPAIEQRKKAEQLAAESGGRLTAEEALGIITYDHLDPDLEDLRRRIDLADRRKGIRFERHLAIGASAGKT